MGRCYYNPLLSFATPVLRSVTYYVPRVLASSSARQRRKHRLLIGRLVNKESRDQACGRSRKSIETATKRGSKVSESRSRLRSEIEFCLCWQSMEFSGDEVKSPRLPFPSLSILSLFSKDVPGMLMFIYRLPFLPRGIIL